MEAIVKSFLGVFFLVLITFLGIGLIYASVSMRNAQYYASTVANEIRAANYMDSAVEVCKEEARENGYTLTTEIVKSKDGGIKYGNLYLDYQLIFPILHISEPRTITMGI